MGHESAYTSQRPDKPSRVPVNTPIVLSQRQADVRIAWTYLGRPFFSLLRRHYCLFRRSQQVRTHRALRDAKANNGCKKKKKKNREALEGEVAACTTMPVVLRRAPSRASRATAFEALIVTSRDNSGATHASLSCD